MFARPNPLAVALLALTGCGKLADSVFCGSGGCGWAPGEWARVAALANPGAPEPDLSNEWRDTGVAGLLGKQFFFDDAFSGNATQVDALKRTSPPARAPAGQAIGIACATCHDLEYGGVDVSSSPGHVSVGAGWTDVNALSVINSPYRQVVFWNGRADSLWALNVIVAESSTTMNGNRLRTAHQIATRYKMAWEKAFGAGSIDADAIAALPPDGKPGNDPNTCAPTDPNEPFGDAYDCLSAQQKDMVTRVLVNWAKAIAVFESKLVSVDSPFDEFVAEGPSSTRISAAAIRGARLFVGKAACVDCHSGPQLTDELFHNIGVPQTGVAVPRTGDCSTSRVPCNCSPAGSGPCLPWGAWDGLNKLRGSSAKWLRTAAWSGNPGDTSRDPYVHLPLTDALKGAWRTPSLRNVARTAPYMHDGGYATLQEVVWHYNSGGQTAGPEQVGDLSPQIKPLMLTDAEQSDLVAFLESLTGAPLASEIKAVPGLPAAPEGTGGTSGNSGAGGMGGSGALGSAGAGPVGGSGAGGTAAGGRGTTGAAGSGGGPSTQLRCSGAPPGIPLITNFDGAGPGPPIALGPPGRAGRVFTRSLNGAAPPVVSLTPGAGGGTALSVTRPPNQSAGTTSSYEFGLTFDDCVDGSAYGAIQFTSVSSAPSCQIQFSVISRTNVTSTEDPRGVCPQAPCDPMMTPIVLGGVQSVPFAAGSTPTIDPRFIIGVRWRVPDSCGVAATIDDIQFVNK